MSRSPSEFGSGLTRVAEFTPTVGEEDGQNEQSLVHNSRERTSKEQAQEMWDVYQDLKNAWIDFVRKGREKRRADNHDLEGPPAPFYIHINLLDNNNSLSREFHATPIFKKLYSRLRVLWQDESTRSTWQEAMKENANEWTDVNGSWEKYLETRAEIVGLEENYNQLLKEKFDERGKPIKKRSRTLVSDLTDAEMALDEKRAIIGAMSHTEPKLATRILAYEMAERRREFQSVNRFMWSKSRREILEKVGQIISNQENLRLIVLEGEAGTGKTTLAKMLAKHFTGADFLRVNAGNTTKTDRALMADEKLEAGSSPTIYQTLLYAVTGKERPTDEMSKHDGLTVFIDELNKMSNDEVGKLVTELEEMKVGQRTGYRLTGANPDDIVQPKALALAAQNPAGSRFHNRTSFTPEVDRKMEVIQVDFFAQTNDNPELYEAFLIAMQNQDGNIWAKKDEISPPWKEVKDMAKKTKQDKLEIGEDKGGVLWRLAKMLHESYENLANRPNVLTADNPEAKLSGRVLPPGDIFNKWLQEYKKEVKKGVSLEHFLSQKFLDWINNSFKKDADVGDRQLYLDLAKKFRLISEDKGKYSSLPNIVITPEFITERQAAELSPRVPRPIIPEEGAIGEAHDYKKIKFNFIDDSGTKQKGVDVRIDETNKGDLYFKTGQAMPIYVVVGAIKESIKYPDLVGKIILAENDKPDKKMVVANLVGFEKKEPERSETELEVKNALNPYREALLESGIPNIENSLLATEKRDVKINLSEVLAKDIESYQASGLTAWANNLKQVDFSQMTPEKRKIIEQEIADGAIPIFMPARQTQLDTTIENYTKSFTPIWIGQNKTIVDAVFWDYFQNLIQNKAQELAKDVPNRPYLSLQKPTQRPDSRTCNKTVTDQLTEFAKIQVERKKNKRHPANITNPAEYGALQKRFTEQVKNTCPTNPSTINPLDKDTFTRFINLALSSDGLVPRADFDPSGARLVWYRDDAVNPYDDGGFRLSVRVEF